MADWTDITNAALDGDSPGTQVLFEALRDNPIAIAEGAPGAPKIQTAGIANSAITNDKILDGTISPAKLYPAAAGSLVDCVSFVVSATGQSSYTKIKEIQLVRGGEYTISFALAVEIARGAAYAKIYKNGVAVGTERSNRTIYTTYTETISGWSPGDLLQIYAYTTIGGGSALVKELKVKASFIYNGNVTLE